MAFAAAIGMVLTRVQHKQTTEIVNKMGKTGYFDSQTTNW